MHCGKGKQKQILLSTMKIWACAFSQKQKRVGGYLAARYPIVDNGYYPWILTDAGSVFEFGYPGRIGERRQTFSAGLPVPSGFTESRKTWSGNPFVPENGFGEIRLAKKIGRGSNDTFGTCAVFIPGTIGEDCHMATVTWRRSNRFA